MEKLIMDEKKSELERCFSKIENRFNDWESCKIEFIAITLFLILDYLSLPFKFSDFRKKILSSLIDKLYIFVINFGTYEEKQLTFYLKDELLKML